MNKIEQLEKKIRDILESEACIDAKVTAITHFIWHNRMTASGSASAAAHYQRMNPQPIEIIEMALTPEEFRGFLHGNVIKYSLRCGAKDEPEREMQKAEQYAHWYADHCEGKKIVPPRSAEDARKAFFVEIPGSDKAV